MKTLKQVILEAKKSSRKDMDPPNILVMKRKSIRNFNNGQRVALYYIEKLNKYVTIPYDSKGDITVIPENE
jgi:hypothetical protein